MLGLINHEMNLTIKGEKVYFEMVKDISSA
jgi:hypothetical protein